MKMKKYLMTGIAALALCAGFTSCSHDLEPMSQEEITNLEAQKIVKNYEAAFVQTFGKPAANHQWGFGSLKTRTAYTNSNQWFPGPEQAPMFAEAGLVKPDMVSQEEEDFVTNWFRTNSDKPSANVDLSTFFVQQVHFGTDVYYAQDPINPWLDNEHTQKRMNSVVGGEHMDWLCAYSPEGTTIYPNGQQTISHDDHMNNFNTSWPTRYYETDPAIYKESDELKSLQLMMNSSTRQFGFSESYNTNPYNGEGNRNADNKRIYYNYKLAYITFNGKTNLYVGFDYESHGERGDFEPNGLYDDRIVKIVPGNGILPPPPSEWDIRIIGEDLNATAEAGDTENSDWDFNDVVIDVKFTGANTCTVRIAAAGGTLPLIVGVANPVDGQSYNDNEIHHLLGQPVGTMVNTNAYKKSLPSATVAEEDLPTIDLTISGVEAQNGANIPIYVEKVVNGQKKWFELQAKQGQPAAKIGVAPSFRIVDERNRIDSEAWYPGFSQWVQDQDYIWY